MDFTLQRHCAKYIYYIPNGLRELMSDISREVIRNKPENMYSYIADYLDALMITRENARVAAKLVESIADIAETTVNILVEVGLSREEANVIVTIIQTHFRAYLANKHKHDEEDSDVTMSILHEICIPIEKQEAVALIIQNAYKKFTQRKEREKLLIFGMVDWRIAARSAIALYRRTGVTNYEANHAATLIKAAYKGYYTRRIMRKLLKQGLSLDNIPMEDFESAASLICESYDDDMIKRHYYGGKIEPDFSSSQASIKSTLTEEYSEEVSIKFETEGSSYFETYGENKITKEENESKYFQDTNEETLNVTVETQEVIVEISEEKISEEHKTKRVKKSHFEDENIEEPTARTTIDDNTKVVQQIEEGLNEEETEEESNFESNESKTDITDVTTDDDLIDISTTEA